MEIHEFSFNYLRNINLKGTVIVGTFTTIIVDSGVHKIAKEYLTFEVNEDNVKRLVTEMLVEELKKG